jgi:glycerol-3-phosphate O-acyltransferase / dihydroxyacetone phosphate acyltransferase
VLLRDTVVGLAGLPFFLLPLIIHAPAYALGRLGARLVEDEEETQAQNKVVFGFIFLLAIYPAAFYLLWAFFWYTPLGAVVSLSLVWLLAIYHTRLVSGTYASYLFIQMH